MVIPASVTSLGASPGPNECNYTFGSSEYFSDNSVAQLTEAIINAKVTEIPNACFAYQVKLSKISLPSTIKRIGCDAFVLCPITSPSSSDLPEALEEIGARAFSGAHFTSVTFHDKISKIDNSAFNNCQIARIDLHSSITSINATAFEWGYVTTFICRATTVPETPQEDEWGNSFSPFYKNKGVCKVQMPAESLQTYKEAWGQYFGEENISVIE